MNDSLVKSDYSAEALVCQVADEFLRRQEAGERPEVEEYAARHPEAAGLIRKVLTSLKALDASLRGEMASSGDAVSGTLGDYRLIREVGRGGMGVVYEAEQISLGRRVALKVLPFAATMDPRQLQRFHNEARAAASLDHPHIVPVYAVGCERGVHFYAMKFIDGRTLAEVIAGQTPSEPGPSQSEPRPLGRGGDSPVADAPGSDTVPVAAASTQVGPRDAGYYRRAAEWGVQAALALEHAHALGIVHRDVKPANLMIDERGGLWVTDFGLARTGQSDLTMSGDVVGTLRYMSPEQALAKHGLVDHRSDVYSLGATLYELLTLRPAIEGKDRQEILQQLAIADPPNPHLLDRSIPIDLETILLKALARDPDERYRFAAELADDLRRFLEHQPIRARRPSLADRGRKWVRRHTTTVVSALLLLLLGVAALGISAILILQARNEAVQQRQAAEEREGVMRQFLYAADMKRAHGAWHLGNLPEALAILARHRPEPGREDLRGFEWYYLRGQCLGHGRIVRQHAGDVYCVTWSPDGKTLASAGKDGTVQLGDVTTGQIRTHLRGHTNEVNWATFSPDGRMVATASDDRSVRLWDSATGRQLHQLNGHTGGAVGVVFSPDGKMLASSGEDRTLRFWDPDTGQHRFTLEGHTGRIETLAFSPDGQTVATGGKDEKLTLWDVSARKARVTWRLSEGVYAVAFARHRPFVAVALGDGTVRVWDIQKGQERAALHGHLGVVQSVTLSPNGQWLASGGDDGTVRLWDLSTGTLLKLFHGHQDKVWRVAFTPDGKDLVSSSRDGTVRRWDVAVVLMTRRWVIPFRDPAKVWVKLSPDGKFLVTSGESEPCRLWDLATSQLRAELRGHPADRVRFAFSQDSRLLVTASYEGTFMVWDTATGQRRARFQGLPPILPGFHLAVSPDKTLLIVADEKGYAYWDLRTGLKVARFELPRLLSSHNRAVAVSPDGRLLVVYTDAWSAELRDAADGRLVTTLQGHRQVVGEVAFSPDGKLLATGSVDRSVKLWDLETGSLRATMVGHRKAVGAMTFSPDGKTLVTHGQDGTFRLWHVATGHEMVVIDSEGSDIYGIAFWPDGRTLVTTLPEDRSSGVEVWLRSGAPGDE